MTNSQHVWRRCGAFSGLVCLHTLAALVLPGEGRVRDRPLVAGEGWEEEGVAACAGAAAAAAAGADTPHEIARSDVQASLRPRPAVPPRLLLGSPLCL